MTLKTEHVWMPKPGIIKSDFPGVDWNDILENTVYFWHDNPEHIKKHTLTVYELLEIAVNKKKPYWIK